MGDHIVASFDNELAQLERQVLEMGGQAEAQLSAAVKALLTFDVDAAERIIAKDADIDEIERKIEAAALSILARRQPMANDLRYVFGTVKIAGSLERVGDYAKNIAKRTIVLAKHPEVPTPDETAALAVRVTKSLREVMDSFAARDAYRAEQVWEHDREIDDLAAGLMRGVIMRMSKHLAGGKQSEAELVECGAHHLFICKNLERVGDHATNIAEVIQYQLSGSWVTQQRPKGDSSLQAAG